MNRFHASSLHISGENVTRQRVSRILLQSNTSTCVVSFPFSPSETDVGGRLRNVFSRRQHANRSTEVICTQTPRRTHSRRFLPFFPLLLLLPKADSLILVEIRCSLVIIPSLAHLSLSAEREAEQAAAPLTQTR